MSQPISDVLVITNKWVSVSPSVTMVLACLNKCSPSLQVVTLG